MCSVSVLCPLCAQTSFTSIDALRNSLIKVANGPLPCPICNELFLGLDKLTIHLFSHTNLMTNETPTTTTITSIQKTQNICETKNTSETSKSPTQLEKSENLNSTSEMITMAREQNRVLNENKTDIITNNSDTFNILDLQHLNFKEISSTKLSPSNEVNQLSSCDICEFTFRNKQLRDMHFNLVHQNSSNSTIGQQTLINGSPTSSSTIEHEFKCHLCAKTYKTKGSLRVHLKVVHMLGLANGNNNKTKLNICDRIRHKESKVQKPIVNTKLTTQQFSNNIQSQCKPTIVLQSTNLPNSINSSTLTQNSPQLQNLMLLTRMQQVKAEHPLAISTENVNGSLMQAFDPNLLNSNVLLVYTPQAGELSKESLNKPSVDNPKIWECDVCSKSFTTKYFLKKHKRLHTGEMPYTCEICARTFTFQQSYHKHLLYHSDEKPHICATCGRAFKEVSTLHNHERIHSGEKPFKCEICGKCFRQRVSFLVHTRIHTGVMPYKCEECQKNFRYKVSLRTHKCARSVESIPDDLETSVHQPNSPQFQNNANAIKEQVSKIYGNQNSPASMEIAAINNAANDDDANCVEALLSKTIDDIVVESCKKMGIGNENNSLNNDENNLNMKIIQSSQARLEPSPGTVNGFNEGSSSPLQKLQEMRLYSPKFDLETTTNENTREFAQMFFK